MRFASCLLGTLEYTYVIDGQKLVIRKKTTYAEVEMLLCFAMLMLLEEMVALLLVSQCCLSPSSTMSR